MRSFLRLAGFIAIMALCCTTAVLATDVSGTISTDTVWDLAGSPYVVKSNVTISGGNSLATLTIEPGVEVKFFPNTALYIGSYNAGVTDGKIVAQGTAENPITFEAYWDDTKAEYRWRSIYFEAWSDDSSILDNCVIQTGVTGIFLTDASPTVQNSTISDFVNYGVNVVGESDAVVQGNTFQGVKSALFVVDKSTGSIDFSNNTVENSIEFGINVESKVATPQIYNNNITTASHYVMFVYPTTMGGIWGNTGSSADPTRSMIYVAGGDVLQDATWSEDQIPFLISSNIFVKGNAGTLVTLTIEDGVQLLFEEHKGLYVGTANVNEPAKLMASGATLTSFNEVGFEESAPLVQKTGDNTTDALIPVGWWYALHFDVSSDPSSVVDNCTIENCENALFTVDASPTFSNNNVSNIMEIAVLVTGSASPTISGNSIDTVPVAVWVDQFATGSPTISGNTIENCTDITVKIESANSMPVISDNTFNNNKKFLVDLFPNQVTNLSGSTGSDNVAEFNMLRVKAGDLSETGSWTETDIPYYISNDLYVRGADNPVLTISDGATLTFSTGSAIWVGEPVGGNPGTLMATGATLTSRKVTGKAAGDWYSVIFDSTADASSAMEGCTVEYAETGITVSGSSPTLTGNTFNNIKDNGAFVAKNSAPTFSGNTFSNTPVGILVDFKCTAAPVITGNTFDSLGDIAINVESAGAAPVITDNTFTNLVDYAASLYPNQVGSMSGSSASDNAPEYNRIRVRPGTMSVNSSWPESELEYLIAGDITVAGNGAEAALAIGPDATLSFFDGVQLWVGSETAANSGKLTATDTKFTSYKLSGQTADDWEGIYFFDNASDDCALDGCTIEYATDGLLIHNNDVSVSGTTFSNILQSGIYAEGMSDVYVDGSTFDTMFTGVFYEASAVGELDVLNSTLTNINSDVISVKNVNAEIMVSGNEFTNNNKYVIQLHPDQAQFVTGNTYADNRFNAIYIFRGFISTDAVWSELGVNYYIFDDVFVEDAVDMPTLTIEPGVVVTFNKEADLVVGSQLNGALNAAGTGANKVQVDDPTGKLVAMGATFTSSNDFDPKAGEWGAIIFDDAADDSSKLRRCTIEYATNGVQVNQHAFLEANVFQNNLESNVFCYGGSPTVMYNDLLGAKRGVYARLEGQPVINYNNIVGSTLFGVLNESQVLEINAENNWWGHASGPAGNGPGAGSPVSDRVDYDPFLGQVFVPVFPPMAFSLLTPEDEAVYSTADVTFDWEDAYDDDPGDAVTYNLYVSVDPSFAPLLTIAMEGLEDSEYTWDPAAILADYAEYILNSTVYWKVKAVDTNTEGTESTETFSFMIEVLPPAEFSLTSPADDTTVTENTVQFIWEPTTNSELGGNMTYTLYLSEDAEFTSPMTQSGLTETTFTWAALERNKTYYWKVKAVDEYSDGTWSSETYSVSVTFPDAITEAEAVPTVYSLSQNYPNPFNPVTSIKYGLPNASHVTVTVHNALGQEIATLMDGFQNAGYHTIAWNAVNYGSGVYFYKITAGDFTQIKKAVLTK